MTKLATIEGIGENYAKKLAKAGITSTEKLLERCGSPAARKELVAATGISDKLILRWANMADLFRIKGVGGEYAELLEAAGVDSVPELKQRKAVNLHQMMVAANAKKKLVRQVPGLAQVEGWIGQAKGLPRSLRY